MKRFAPCAVLSLFGTLAFCQSPVISEKPAQAPLENLSFHRTFDLDISQLGLTSSPARSFKAQSCDGSNANNSQANAKADSNPLFHLPCILPDTFTLMAQNNEPAAPLSFGLWPRAKSIPIPTQWPGAKFEQIPTTWPNLKMLRIKEGHPPSAPAK